jgi:hypothetical protein
VAAVRTAPSPVAKVRAAGSVAGIRAVRGVLRDLPRVTATLSGSPAGDQLSSWFRPDRALPLNRAPIALLDLPASTAEYLAGRKRQALRTNLRRAADAGLTCARVTDEQELLRVAEHLSTRRHTTPATLLGGDPHPSPSCWFTAAYDREGEPVALSRVLVDRTWAGLVYMVSATGHDEALLVRYAMHAAVVGALVEAGVGHFVVGGSMLLTDPGVRYFQQRTGFRPVWLDVRRG